jgi:hypothetical protein
MTTHKTAIIAKPVMKLKGLINCKVDTGWADSSRACTSIRLLSSCILQPIQFRQE